MGIKCSLLGHRFAETEVTEEREEQGSEVVVTIREVEQCDRCGAERVVSENKEVTSLETAEATVHPEMAGGVRGYGDTQSQNGGGPPPNGKQQSASEAGDPSCRSPNLQGETTHDRRNRRKQRHGAVEPARKVLRISVESYLAARPGRSRLSEAAPLPNQKRSCVEAGKVRPRRSLLLVSELESV